jgi:PEGA domain-containing protein
MAILDESKGRRGGRRSLVVALFGVVVVAAAGAGVWLVSRRPAERPNASLATPRERPSPRAEPSPSPTSRPAVPEPRAIHAPRGEPRPEAAAPTLRVDADVPGANVFLDHKFLGTTPVETRDLPPGAHRLNVSAEGYDMYAETIELASSPREVMVRFREVQLDERVDVVHKHGIGSCRGRLLATTAGLRYEADKPADSFAVGYDTLQPLEVDYLNRNLRVRQRGGKTWNFTADSPDGLLGFQQAVEKARKRMSAPS